MTHALRAIHKGYAVIEQPVEYQSRRTGTSAPRLAACYSARNIGVLCVILGFILGLGSLALFREMDSRNVLNFSLLAMTMLATAAHLGAGILFLIASVKIVTANLFWEKTTVAAAIANLASSGLFFLALFPSANVAAITCAAGILGPVAWWQVKVMRRMRALHWID